MHCITFAFSQCFMYYRCVFTILKSCVLVGLDWAKPMIYLLLHVICSCIFHAYVPFISFLLLLTMFGTCLSLSLFLSLCLFLLISLLMAPKKSKSIPSQNPLHSKASSSSSIDPTPSHVRFLDNKARKDILENFSRCGIHSERQVILSDFFDFFGMPSHPCHELSHCKVFQEFVLGLDFIVFNK